MIKPAKYKTYLANLGLFYSAAIWGSTFFIVKKALNDIDPVILVGYRFTIAAVLLMIPLIIAKKSLLKYLKEGALLGLLLWILYVAQTIGLKYTTAANSGLITGLFVAFVPIFSIIVFKKLPTKTAVLATVISIIGLIILTGGLQQINNGDMITLITAVTYALHILYADRIIKAGADPYILSFQQFAFVGLASLLTGVVFRLPFTIGSTQAFNMMLFLAIFPSLTAFAIQLVAQKYTPPIRVSLILALEPVFAVLFAWTLGNEHFEVNKAIGALLIFAALIISALPSREIRFRK
ncbi:MAG: DMT family transporter [candidate division Zixibacteria bacterium]|nr:DMT family transporter [candidate division Zixibacteria bacterium]